MLQEMSLVQTSDLRSGNPRLRQSESTLRITRPKLLSKLYVTLVLLVRIVYSHRSIKSNPVESQTLTWLFRDPLNVCWDAGSIFECSSSILKKDERIHFWVSKKERFIVVMGGNWISVSKKLTLVFRFLVISFEPGVNMSKKGSKELINTMSLYLLGLPGEDGKAASTRSGYTMTDQLWQDTELYRGRVKTVTKLSHTSLK